MQAPQIAKGNLSEMSDEEIGIIADRMYERLMAQRKQILTAKIKAIDINNADLSKLTDDEIAVCLEYEILKHRTIP